MGLGLYCLRVGSRSSLRKLPSIALPCTQLRSIAGTPIWLDSDKKSQRPPGLNEEHQGTHSRIDREVKFEYPADKDVPQEGPVLGRTKRTLASFSLEGRVAAITGGARGLGLVMAHGLVESGANVALVDLNKDEAQKQASEFLEQFRKENPDTERIPKITAHHADVGDHASVTAAVAEIAEQHGKIDHLVTSAGFTENIDAIAYPPERMRKLWAVNVDGTYYFATQVARHLMQRDATGSIVMVGSMSGAIVNVPQPQAPYNASKAAVRHLAASLAVEWAHAGIRVNCISPGYMRTPLTKKVMDANPELKQKWTSLTPTGRMGVPEDLMGAVVYLLSDASAFTTGADLRVDGGYTLT